MIEESYVSFETAKLLKEKGFQQLPDNCGYFTTEIVYSINTDDNGKHHFVHQYPAGVLHCPYFISYGGTTRGCMLGYFPIDCENCQCPDKRYVEVTTTSTTYKILM